MLAPGARGTKAGASADSGCERLILGPAVVAETGAAEAVVAEAPAVVGAAAVELWELELEPVLVPLVERPTLCAVLQTRHVTG